MSPSYGSSGPNSVAGHTEAIYELAKDGSFEHRREGGTETDLTRQRRIEEEAKLSAGIKADVELTQAGDLNDLAATGALKGMMVARAPRGKITARDLIGDFSNTVGAPLSGVAKLFEYAPGLTKGSLVENDFALIVVSRELTDAGQNFECPTLDTPPVIPLKTENRTQKAKTGQKTRTMHSHHSYLLVARQDAVEAQTQLRAQLSNGKKAGVSIGGEDIHLTPTSFGIGISSGKELEELEKTSLAECLFGESYAQGHPSTKITEEKSAIDHGYDNGSKITRKYRFKEHAEYKNTLSAGAEIQLVFPDNIPNIPVIRAMQEECDRIISRISGAFSTGHTGTRLRIFMKGEAPVKLVSAINQLNKFAEAQGINTISKVTYGNLSLSYEKGVPNVRGELLDNLTTMPDLPSEIVQALREKRGIKNPISLADQLGTDARHRRSQAIMGFSEIKFKGLEGISVVSKIFENMDPLQYMAIPHLACREPQLQEMAAFKEVREFMLSVYGITADAGAGKTSLFLNFIRLHQLKNRYVYVPCTGDDDFSDLQSLVDGLRNHLLTQHADKVKGHSAVQEHLRTIRSELTRLQTNEQAGKDADPAVERTCLAHIRESAKYLIKVCGAFAKQDGAPFFLAIDDPDSVGPRSVEIFSEILGLIKSTIQDRRCWGEETALPNTVFVPIYRNLGKLESYTGSPAQANFYKYIKELQAPDGYPGNVHTANLPDLLLGEFDQDGMAKHINDEEISPAISANLTIPPRTDLLVTPEVYMLLNTFATAGTEVTAKETRISAHYFETILNFLKTATTLDGTPIIRIKDNKIEVSNLQAARKMITEAASSRGLTGIDLVYILQLERLLEETEDAEKILTLVTTLAGMPVSVFEEVVRYVGVTDVEEKISRMRELNILSTHEKIGFKHRLWEERFKQTIDPEKVTSLNQIAYDALNAIVEDPEQYELAVLIPRLKLFQLASEISLPQIPEELDRDSNEYSDKKRELSAAQQKKTAKMEKHALDAGLEAVQTLKTDEAMRCAQFLIKRGQERSSKRAEIEGKLLLIEVYALTEQFEEARAILESLANTDVFGQDIFTEEKKLRLVQIALNLGFETHRSAVNRNAPAKEKEKAKTHYSEAIQLARLIMILIGLGQKEAAQGPNRPRSVVHALDLFESKIRGIAVDFHELVYQPYLNLPPCPAGKVPHVHLVEQISPIQASAATIKTRLDEVDERTRQEIEKFKTLETQTTNHTKKQKIAQLRQRMERIYLEIKRLQVALLQSQSSFPVRILHEAYQGDFERLTAITTQSIPGQQTTEQQLLQSSLVATTEAMRINLELGDQADSKNTAVLAVRRARSAAFSGNVEPKKVLELITTAASLLEALPPSLQDTQKSELRTAAYTTAAINPQLAETHPLVASQLFSFAEGIAADLHRRSKPESTNQLIARYNLAQIELHGILDLLQNPTNRAEGIKRLENLINDFTSPIRIFTGRDAQTGNLEFQTKTAMQHLSDWGHPKEVLILAGQIISVCKAGNITLPGEKLNALLPSKPDRSVDQEAIRQYVINLKKMSQTPPGQQPSAQARFIQGGLGPNNISQATGKDFARVSRIAPWTHWQKEILAA